MSCQNACNECKGNSYAELFDNHIPRQNRVNTPEEVFAMLSEMDSRNSDTKVEYKFLDVSQKHSPSVQYKFLEHSEENN